MTPFHAWNPSLTKLCENAFDNQCLTAKFLNVSLLPHLCASVFPDCWPSPRHSMKVSFRLYEFCPNVYWFLSPQRLIKNEKCGSAFEGSSYHIQVQFPVTAWGLFFLPELFFQNIYYGCLGAIAPAFLKSTEVHVGKDNVPYTIKLNK